ncbi:MAG: BlaI/MecI/CopY family transcriptional regulator [Bryobacteraceae bacterium]|nr:BlaI/MecI/CopY family transcriptional regulator [Bryobacterales bacterium]MEB2362186.1 BlaI/MecI/CopY family transcriptional regulator [Bryobacterales bacterium]NUM99805.1 BlaI/MecI/CopY family transcriptional regulator [Bryobacteraceae bacterium]
MRKPGPRRDIPPPLELECLKVLWSTGESNVKTVRDALMKDRVLAYTTVMTVLDRLAKRGGVSRRKIGRAFVYSPLLSREALRKAAVAELVESYFDGSEDALVKYLTDSDTTAPEVTASGWQEEHLDTVLL